MQDVANKHEEEAQAPQQPARKNITITPDQVEPFTVITELLKRKSPPHILYHYTGTAGLTGILGDQAVRLTEATFLNDRSEMAYAKALIQSVIRDRRQVSDDARVTAFLETAEGLVSGMFQGLHLFVACFCEDGDLLSQWRGYSKGAGMYAMGFDAQPLHEPGASGLAPYSLYPIIYKTTEQRKIVSEVITAGVRRHLLGMEGPRDEEGGLFTPVAFMTLALSFCLIIFKHGGFAEEKEWRIVVVVNSEKDDTPIMFRDGPWYPTPYTMVSFENDGLPLVEVKCGPAPEPGLATRAVRMLLDSHGFEAVSVSESEIPLRR